MVERTAVNRDVVGSSPTRGVLVHRQMSVNFFYGQVPRLIPVCQIMRCDSDSGKKLIKSMVLRTADRQGMC